MIKLPSITDYFTMHGRLRLSQRKTLAALVWAVMRKPVPGIAASGHSLAMAKTAKAKHAIQRVDRLFGQHPDRSGGRLWRPDRGRHWVRTPGLSHPGLDRSEDQRWPVSNPEY